MVKRTEQLDPISKAVLYDGANLSQLGSLFRMDHRVLVEKLTKGGCKPVGERNGVDIYAVHEVAPYLVKPAYEIEEYLKRMHHNDLPKHLTKEFWAGLRSRQEYEQKEGNLWPTSRVVEVMGGVMKLIKMSARLMSDQVDRQAELSDRQRAIVRSQCDGMLEEAYRTILESFATAPTNMDVIEQSEQMVAQVQEDDDEL
nr:MAG TPA: Protein of unknown function (DUF1441) [Caudoviricetes sp.]